MKAQCRRLTGAALAFIVRTLEPSFPHLANR
jgi:hypothetical protein